MNHYLVLTWPEDPDNPTFNSQLDWDISHPPECQYDHEGFVWDCAIGYQVDWAGSELFGGQGDREIHYSLSPAMFPIEFYHESWSTGSGTEHDVGVRMCESYTARDYEKILGELYLYVNWRYCTKQLTGQQKQAWAHAVEQWSERLEPGDPMEVDRWWLG